MYVQIGTEFLSRNASFPALRTAVRDVWKGLPQHVMLFGICVPRHARSSFGTCKAAANRLVEERANVRATCEMKAYISGGTRHGTTIAKANRLGLLRWQLVALERYHACVVLKSVRDRMLACKYRIHNGRARAVGCVYRIQYGDML